MSVFLVDRNIPIALARMLDHFEREDSVVYLDDWFDRATADTVWLTEAAKRNPKPAIVSGDGRILTNEAEAQVLRELPLSFFHFAPAWFDLPWRDMAWKAVKIWPSIVEANRARQPTVFRVPISASKVEFFCLTSDLGRAKRKA